MNSFDEFRTLWLEQTSDIKVKKDLEHLVFIVVYPDKVKWDFGVEKQTQTTCLQTSGGVTGAGTGHRQILCYKSELNDILEAEQATHAMIVTVGMVFDMVANKTSIQHFYDFAKDDTQYCKGHILVVSELAYLHHQHVEINLTQWRKLGKPDIFQKWTEFERSDKNYHDDYTPYWLTPKGFPTIMNFNEEDRRIKAWSYNTMKQRTEIQNQSWEILKHRNEGWQDDLDKDNYFRQLRTRLNSAFYTENTESVGNYGSLDEKFDIIFSPTAGYSTEVLAEQLNFDGDIVFYDYSEENLDIKQNIVEMNMSMDEIRTYSQISDHVFSFNVGNKYSEVMRERAKTYGDLEPLRALQKKMRDTHNIEYWLMDLVCPDYRKLKQRIKGKNVFFNASNAFSYHITHSRYTLDTLVQSFNKLHEVLSTSKHYVFKGTRPTKQKYVA